MDALEKLDGAGQSLWLNNVAREQIYNGSLTQYIEGGVITGVCLSPQAVCHTLNSSPVYDVGIYNKINQGLYGEPLALELIFEDLLHAADMLRNVFDRTAGVDGWASLPMSPLLTSDPSRLLQTALVLHTRLKRENTLITVPGLPDMSEKIEEIVFAGIPINISLIYSCDQYLNAAEAHLRGIERRIDAGLNPAVPGFISIPVFHIAAALSKKIPKLAATRASLAIARKIYTTMRTLHTSRQWERAYNAGARPLRLIWLSPDDDSTVASNISLYDQLVAPFTVAAMSEWAILEFITHGHPEALLATDDDDCEEIPAGHQKAGLNFKPLAVSLQDEAAALQVTEWIMLLDVVARKSTALVQAKPVAAG